MFIRVSYPTVTYDVVFVALDGTSSHFVVQK